jgi:Ran GTPase-activating protein (RanGAP) involved in mRNA processing and transport
LYSSWKQHRESPSEVQIGLFLDTLDQCSSCLDLRAIDGKLLGNTILDFLVSFTNALIHNFTISSLDLSFNPQIMMSSIAQAISFNKSITSLNLSHNNLDVNAATYIAALISSNSTIQILNISGNRFNQGLDEIAHAFCVNSTVTELDMSDSRTEDVPEKFREVPYTFGTTSTTHLAVGTIIVQNATICKLNIRNCDLDDRGISHIAEALRNNTTVTDVDISENQYSINSSSFSAVSSMIASNTTLVHFKCDGRLFQVPDFSQALQANSTITNLAFHGPSYVDVALADVIKSNTAISQLNFLSIGLSPQASESIASELGCNNFLTDIKLCLNIACPSLDSPGAIALTNLFSLNTSLTKVDLSNCKLGKYGVTAIANGLMYNTTVTDLTLKHCDSDEEGAVALARMLVSNIGLKRLHLSFTRPQNCGFVSNALELNVNVAEVYFATPCLYIDVETSFFSDLIMANCSITKLNVSGWRVCKSEDTCSKFFSALSSNTSIVDLDLSNCFIGFDRQCDWTLRNIPALARMVESNATITRLNLKNNQFTSNAISLIAAAMELNSSVTNLDLSRNDFFDELAARAIVSLASRNRTLVELSVIDSMHDRPASNTDNLDLRFLKQALLFHERIKCSDRFCNW